MLLTSPFPLPRGGVLALCCVRVGIGCFFFFGFLVFDTLVLRSFSTIAHVDYLIILSNTTIAAVHR